ncbi:FAD-binding oxidoreductase [uncultured Ramlibacter sp.]|uniref:NAD(P)/FAD-dependent oxidoreductase n=1 Tax=uncultured Ramlibacter sp. TaxID=260755 RepID=UPI0026369D88|nr:FAD-binding oxidoreductase [uncultured Ramlibacter sp.]
MSERIRADVTIVGGGIVGSAAALFLCRFGLSVVLLERGLCGAAASGVNYGGVRTQGRPVSQLPLALRARRIWERLPEFIGIDGEYLASGHLKLARSEADLHSLQAYRERVREHGLDLHLITGRAFREAYPWLGDRAIAGSFCAQDGHANPRLVSPAFARAAQAAGARVIERCEVTQLEHTGAGFVASDGRGLEVRSPWLLNCAGAWALDVARRFGDSAPMTSIHPGMAVTEPVPRFMDVNVGVEGGGIYGRQTERGNCVMGGSRGVGKGSFYAQPSTVAMEQLCRDMAQLFPPLANAHVIRFWSGVEGSLPDHQPVIGPSPGTPQLLHAFGFCGAGFQTGPAVGEALAELVHLGRSSAPLDAFSMDRFAPDIAQSTPAAAGSRPRPPHAPQARLTEERD